MAQKFIVPITVRQLASAGSDAFTIYVDQDVYSRIQIQAGGRIVWGSGDAAADTNLYRDAANVLKTDDTFKAAGLFVDGIEIDPTGAASDQVLKFDGTKFVPGTASTVGLLNDLSDVTTASVATGDVLTWNGTYWTNEEPTGGGASVTVSESAPASPAAGDLWFDSILGVMFIYYDDVWVEVGGGGVVNFVLDTVTAKGDLIVGTADGAADNLAVGANGTYLKANSSTATGLEWASVPAIDAAAIISAAGGDGTNGQALTTNGSGVLDFTTIVGTTEASIISAVGADGAAGSVLKTNGSGDLSFGDVALGTNTSGIYVADLVSGTGVIITNGSSESASPTIAIGQDVATSASVSFAALTVNGLTSVGGHIIPDANETYDLGSVAARFRDIYLSGTSINLGGAEITSDGSAISFPGGLAGNVSGNADTASALETARTFSLGGSLSGSVSFDGTSDVTITAAIQPDSIALGTDTTGNYVSDLTAGTGVTVTHTPSEGSSPTIAIGQSVATSASVTFAQVETTGDVVVGGNLTVNGTTTTLNTETLAIEDNIIVLNSNVTGSPTTNAGIEVERGTSPNATIRWNETSDKWEFTEDGSTYYDVASEDFVTSLAVSILDDISDVSASAAVSGDFLKYNGTAWINDPINLGADTTGSYVESLVAGTGVTLTNNSGEGATPTVAVDTSVIQARVANVTDTEIGYLDGVTSAIQTQIDEKAQSADIYDYYITNAGSGAYLVNGVSNGTIHFKKGKRYKVIVNAVGHPFWIQTVSGGYSAGNVYSTGITNNGTQNGTIVVELPQNAPNELYYACQYHSSMAGSISTLSIEPDVKTQLDTKAPLESPTFTGTVTLPDNTVTLGTKTTGDYVSSLVAGTGVTLTNNSGETSTPTIAIGQSVSTSASVTFANVTSSLTGNASTATTLETARTIAGQSFDGSANISIAPTDLTGVTATAVELNYVDGVTSPIQTQLNDKASLASPTFTGTVVLPDNTVALGTKTTGDYVSSLVAGTGIIITNNSGETATPTIAIGQSVATSASVTFDTITVNNLTVTGTQTSTSQSTLNVDDNEIILNANVTGSPTLNAGIVVERGTSTNVDLRWNETLDKWQFTNDGTTYSDLGAGGATISATAPASPSEGAIWFNSTTLEAYVYYDSHWLQASGEPDLVEDLTDLSDVLFTAPVSGQFLKFDGTRWVNGTIPTINTLDDIGDVSASVASPGQFLKWNGTAWVPETIIGGATISDSAPASPLAGQLWFDSTVGKTFVYYDSQWIEVGGVGTGARMVSSSSAPASPLEGSMWFDTDTAQTFVYYDSSWVEIGASGVTASVQDSAPAAPVSGQIWFNSLTGGTYVYYGTNWIEVGASPFSALVNTINAKGDLLVGTADNTIGGLTAGSDGQVLTVDSSTGTGLKWDTPVSTGKAIAMSIVFSG